MFRSIFFVFVLMGAFLSISLHGGENPQPEPPRRTLAHWVRLIDGSLLIGRVEKIDAESLQLDLRLGKGARVTVPRKNVASLLVIPPVDPALFPFYDRLETPENTETVRLVNGDLFNGRLRSFTDGVFRFDVNIGDGILIESLSIPMRRVRSITFSDMQKAPPSPAQISLANGSLLWNTSVEHGEHGGVFLNSSLFSPVFLDKKALSPPR